MTTITELAKELRYRRVRSWVLYGLIVASSIAAPVEYLFDRGMLSVAIWIALVTSAAWMWFRFPVATVQLPDGRTSKIRLRHERGAQLRRTGDSWELVVRHDEGVTVLEGEEARRVFMKLIRRRNFDGAADADIETAVSAIDGARQQRMGEWLDSRILGESEGFIIELPKSGAVHSVLSR